MEDEIIDLCAKCGEKMGRVHTCPGAYHEVKPKKRVEGLPQKNVFDEDGEFLSVE